MHKGASLYVARITLQQRGEERGPDCSLELFARSFTVNIFRSPQHYPRMGSKPGL